MRARAVKWKWSLFPHRLAAPVRRVPYLEKAYAKLHGSYDALIGGYVDYGLRDLTGAICEQIIMTPGFIGFNPSDVGAGADGKPPDPTADDDPFWRRLRRYDEDGCLMGCSIQPPPKSKSRGAEAQAPQGACRWSPLTTHTSLPFPAVPSGHAGPC